MSKTSLFFPASILSHILLPYLFPQICPNLLELNRNYFVACVNILIHVFHVHTEKIKLQVITDFIHIYSNQQHLDIDAHCELLHQAIHIREFRELIQIAKIECWFFPLFELLLDQSNNVDKNYALRWACYNGYTSTAELLLDRNADVGDFDHYPLRLASKKGHESTVELLLSRKANVSACDNYALKYASEKGYTSIVALLLDRKADVGAKDNFALRWASNNGHTSTVELLLDRKADISAECDYAIRWASNNGHKSTVELLLERKADANAIFIQ